MYPEGYGKTYSNQKYIRQSYTGMINGVNIVQEEI